MLKHIRLGGGSIKEVFFHLGEVLLARSIFSPAEEENTPGYIKRDYKAVL